MKRTAQVLLLIGGILAWLLAGFYGLVEAWANLAFCLAIANFLMISGLLEREYHRISRRFDDLEEFFLRAKTSIQEDKSGEDKAPGPVGEGADPKSNTR